MIIWNEQQFVDYLMKQFPTAKNVTGIGDDCAVIPLTQDQSLLMTTDALIEGVHFLKEEISPQELGYKAVAVNVSDIHAMGGEPKYVFLSLAVPHNTKISWLKEFIQGIQRGCMKWDLQLLGGDTVGSKRDVFVNIALLGFCHPAHLKFRDAAKDGDHLYVNHWIGDAAGGLKVLQENIFKDEEAQYLMDAHFKPDPQIKEGQWLAMQSGVHAMMDLSDGLDVDLKRMAKASSCEAEVELTKLPISETLSYFCIQHKWDVNQLALAGGEDYCLLFTVSKDSAEHIEKQFLEKFGHPLHPIGQMKKGKPHLQYVKNGKKIDLKLKPFEHFQ